MIFDALTILRGMTPDARAAAALAARWQRALAAEPQLAADLLVLGQVLAKLPATYEAGAEVPAPVDPNRVMIDAGRRELALELLALMNVDPALVARMMESDP